MNRSHQPQSNGRQTGDVRIRAEGIDPIRTKWRLLMLVGAVLLGCSAEQRSVSGADREPRKAVAEAPDEPFGFGLECARDSQKLADAYADLGANWIKLVGVAWELVEPSPPGGQGHRYVWDKVDAHVRPYQKLGLNMLVELKARCHWGGEPFLQDMDTFKGNPSTFPKKEYHDDYAAFVSAVVERYDGDGKDDMPGLKVPIRRWEIDSEAQFLIYWQGTAEQYVEMLEIAYAAVKRADPEAKVVLSGMNFIDLFDDNPSRDTVIQRILALPKDAKNTALRMFDFNSKLLAAGDHYDEIEFHYITNYRAIYGIVDWLRAEQKKQYGRVKPIWAGDAYSGPQFTGAHSLYTPKDADRRHAVLCDPNHPDYAEVEAWYRDEQAQNVVKKFVLAMEMELQGVMMGMLIDWRGRYQFENFDFTGMVDLPSGNPRPVYHTYRMLIDKLQDYRRIERLQRGEQLDVFLYRFHFDDGRVIFVAWREDGELPLKIPVGTPKAVVTEIVSRRGQTAPPVRRCDTTDGVLLLTVGPSPVFVESEGEPK